MIDPELLKTIFMELATEAGVSASAPVPGSAGAGAAAWPIVDSTLWETLPRMHWALWRHQGRSKSAVRLHLPLHVLEDKPARAQITSGRVCERKSWRENWQAGEGYVGDRYYGEDYRLFKQLVENGCFVVLRLREGPAITVEEELPRACQVRILHSRIA